MNRRHLINPYWFILMTAALATTSEVFLKIGAANTKDLPSPLPWLGISGMTSGWVWLGILLTVLSLLTWMQAIRFIPLVIAFTLSNSVHVLVPLACFFFLHETIDLRRWAGIVLVISGLMLIAKPLAKVDARL